MRVHNLRQKINHFRVVGSCELWWFRFNGLFCQKVKQRKEVEKKCSGQKYRCRLHTFIFPKLPPEASYPVKTLRFSSSSRGCRRLFSSNFLQLSSNICFSQFLKKSGMKRALEKYRKLWYNKHKVLKLNYKEP